MEKAFHIKPTTRHTGGFLGTLLASNGVPLAIEALVKLIGKEAPRIGLSKMPPLFVSYQPYVTAQDVKKSQKKGKGLLLGPKSPFNNIPILGAILYQNFIKISH